MGVVRSRAAVLELFRQHRILVIGDVILDEYLTGDCSRISPEAPVPILSVTSSRLVLGGAANTAANVTSLGAQAVLIGLIGRDGWGRQVADQTASAGITFDPVTTAGTTI